MIKPWQIALFWIGLTLILHGQPQQTQPSALKVIREKCVRCHGADKPAGGLRLDSVDNMVKGGKHGPALVPFKPDESLMYKALTGVDNAERMPPLYPLEESEVALIRRWIYRGAMQYSMSNQEP